MAKMTSAEYIKELASSQLTREQLNKLLDRNNISYELWELDNFWYAVLNWFKGKRSDFSAQREWEYMTWLSKWLSQKVKDIDKKIVSLESTKKELDKMPSKVLASVDSELRSIKEDQKVYNTKTLQNLAKKAEKKHSHEMSEIKGIDKQFANIKDEISDRPTRDEVSGAMDKNFVTKDNTFTKEETRNYVKSKLNKIVIPWRSWGSGWGGWVASVVAGAGITVDSADPANPIVTATWVGSWDVTWPASSVNNNITLYDWATGKLIKDSGINVSDITANNDKISFDATASTKVWHITVTQAVNLDTMESDITANNDKVGITAGQASDITANNDKISFDATASTKVWHITVTQAVNLDTMDADIAALANGMIYKGDWNASAGTFPWGGSAKIGRFYYVSVAGTVNGVEFAIGDNIISVVNNASTTTYAPNRSKHDQTDAVQAVVGLTGSVTRTWLLSALTLDLVNNTTDVNKPVSTAQQTALNLKANIASPALTGTPTAPTATAGTNTTQIATTAFATTANNLKANLASTNTFTEDQLFWTTITVWTINPAQVLPNSTQFLLSNSDANRTWTFNLINDKKQFVMRDVTNTTTYPNCYTWMVFGAGSTWAAWWGVHVVRTSAWNWDLVFSTHLASVLWEKMRVTSAWVLSVGGVEIPTVSSTSTLTNKTLTTPIVNWAISQDWTTESVWTGIPNWVVTANIWSVYRDKNNGNLWKKSTGTGTTWRVPSESAGNEYDAWTSGTTKTIDLNNWTAQKLSMTGNCTFTLNNPTVGQTYVLKLTQDVTGSKTATRPASVKKPSWTTLSTTASAIDIATLYYDGTNFYLNIWKAYV